jgi:hypothetical protein
MPSPSQVVEAFFGALSAGKWSSAITLLTADAPDRLRARLLYRVTQGLQDQTESPQIGRISIHRGREPEPDPVLVARFSATSLDRQLGLNTVGDLARIDPSELAERQLEWQCLDEAGNPGPPWGKHIRVLREEVEGPATVNVVYQYLVPDPESYEPDELPSVQQIFAVTCYLRGTDWKMAFPDELALPPMTQAP